MKMLRQIRVRIAALLKGRDKGTVAITFLLSLPIFLLVVGTFVQYALLANARLTLDRAVAAGARAAVTSVPMNPSHEFQVNGTDAIDAEANVRKAVCMVLATVSPKAGVSASGTAQAVDDALRNVGSAQLKQVLPSSFPLRYTYADDSAQITIVRIDDRADAPAYGAPAPRVRITVTYPYQLDVPAINMFAGLLSGKHGVNAGVAGYFIWLSSGMDVQLSPGRETPVFSGGNPQ